MMLGCSGAQPAPPPAKCPDAPTTTSASARVEVLPAETAEANPLPDVHDLFVSREVLAVASSAVRSEIGPSDVRVRQQGDELRIEVDGVGEQGALARCEAVLRAALQMQMPALPDALDEQREDAHRRLAELEQSLRDVPSDVDVGADPEAYVAWASEASRQLAASDSVAVALLDRPEG